MTYMCGAGGDGYYSTRSHTHPCKKEQVNIPPQAQPQTLING